MNPIWQWGLEAIRHIQALGPALNVPMRFFTFLGQEEFFLLLMPLLFWCLDRKNGTHVAALLILSSCINGLFKGFFMAPRPYWFDASLQKATEPSFGLPSGHAQNAVAIWGSLAYYFGKGMKRAWPWVVSILVILLISLSRLYLGVHFPTDVLGGWLLGALCLVGYIALQPRLTPWLARQSLGVQFALSALVAAMVLVLYGLGRVFFHGVPVGYEPSLFAVGMDDAAQGAFSSAGMFLGVGVGLAMERRTVRFLSDGPFWKRLVRYVVGGAVLFGLQLGLKAVFRTEVESLALALRVVRYAMLMLWAIWLWPWLFVRLGLAEREAAQLGPAAELEAQAT